MKGFGAFLQKEFLEILNTWRIWVIPGMIVFFAVTSPIIAMMTPTLVSSLAGSQPGVVITLPEPTAVDAYRQFLKNLNQIVLIAVVIAGAGAISGERLSGTAALVLAKPLSRSGFVLAKLLSQQTTVVVFTTIGAAVCVAVTTALFGPSSIGTFLLAVLLWLVYALLLVAAMTLFSAAFESRGAAIGAGLGFYFVTAVLSIWSWAVEYTFVGLGQAASGLLSGVQADVGWPIATAVVTGLALTALAVLSFQHKEL